MSIPKVIHYCWFGGAEKSKDVQKYISSWRKILTDYQFREWNESNFNIGSSCDYVQEAYQCQKWAFVADYVRLCVLYEFGGVYLDTDVEVLRPFDPLLFHSAFIGAESEYSVCTATIGAEPRSAFIARALAMYEGKHFVAPGGSPDETPNSRLIFKMLTEEDNYRASVKPFFTRDCVIYPAEYFSPLNCYTWKLAETELTYSIHHYAATWKSPKARLKSRAMGYATRLIGEKNREKLKQIIKRRLPRD